jgi:hypothetical protein
MAYREYNRCCDYYESLYKDDGSGEKTKPVPPKKKIEQFTPPVDPIKLMKSVWAARLGIKDDKSLVKLGLKEKTETTEEKPDGHRDGAGETGSQDAGGQYELSKDGSQ